MLSAALVAGAALLLALLRGGSLDRLAATRFEWIHFLVVGLVVQIAFLVWDPPGLSSGQSLTILVMSNLMIAAFLFANRRLTGMVVAGVGMVLNVIVITANGAMPVSQRAVDLAGINAQVPETGLKHELMSDETVLPWLGDVIPVPVLKEILSVGDLVLAFGLAQLVYTRTRSTEASDSSPGASHEPRHLRRRHRSEPNRSTDTRSRSRT